MHSSILTPTPDHTAFANSIAGLSGARALGARVAGVRVIAGPRMFSRWAPETESPETESPETESPETESPDTLAPDTESSDIESQKRRGTEGPIARAPKRVRFVSLKVAVH
jgi:hypothetical protein